MEKVVDLPNRDNIEAEACAWISQLDGDRPPSAEDMAALREWVNRSPLHREELVRLAGIWGDLNTLTELAISIDSTEEARKQVFFSRLFLLRFFAMAAVVLVVMIGLYWVGPQPTNPTPTHLVYATQVGEQQLATLPDGSTVQLNTNSQVEIDYNNQRRKLRLLQGEAHFQVSRDPNRPFEVYAGTGLMRAIGTAFSVYLQDHQVEVIVTEGQVELASVAVTQATADGDKIGDTAGKSNPGIDFAVLEAGQSTSFNHQVNAIQTLKEDEMARKLSWRNGILVFSGESLEFVVEEVSRYTPISIVITDPGIRDIRIGGYFKVGETNAMFDALGSSFGIQVDRIDEQLVHLSQASFASPTH